MDGGKIDGKGKSIFYGENSTTRENPSDSKGLTDNQRKVKSKRASPSQQYDSDSSSSDSPVHSRKIDPAYPHLKQKLHAFVERQTKIQINVQAVLSEAAPSSTEERQYCLETIEREIIGTFKGKNTKKHSHLSLLGNATAELAQLKDPSPRPLGYYRAAFDLAALHQHLAKKSEGRIIARENGKITAADIKKCMHLVDEIEAGRIPVPTDQLVGIIGHIATYSPQLYVELLASIDLETLSPPELHQLYESLTVYLRPEGEAWEVLQGTEAEKWLDGKKHIMPAYSLVDIEESRGYLSQQLLALTENDFTGKGKITLGEPETNDKGFTYYPGAMTKEFDFSEPAMRTLKVLQTAGIIHTTVLQAATTHAGDNIADPAFENLATLALTCKKNQDQTGTYLMQAVMKKHIPEYKGGSSYQCHLYYTGDDVVFNTDYTQARGGFQVIPVKDIDGATTVEYNFPPKSWPSLQAPDMDWTGHQQPEFKPPPPRGAPTKYDSGIDGSNSSDEN